MTNPIPADTLHPTDPVEVARRVNGAVAADLRAQRLRESYRRERLAEPAECRCCRDIERLEGAIFAMFKLADEAWALAAYAAERAEAE